jgi:hypothetical protein
LLLAAIAAVSGCAYESQYLAPLDGRARAVWQDNNVVVDLAGAPASAGCVDELRAWSQKGTLRLKSGDLKRDTPIPPRLDVAPSVAFWVPVYFGPPLVAPAPLVPPVPPHPVSFSPSLALAGAVSGSAPASGSTGGGGGGSGGDGKGIAEVLAVIALIILPALDIAIAAATPENDRSPEAIDQVNVYNDLARSGGTPCNYAAPP